jgi:tRNA threonylcarbamoyl adenosine modification protein YjeE
MTEPATFSLALANETATAHLMADLALLVGPGDVITLSGDLGAGKTAAARAMIRYLAGDDALEVPSPTFTLAQSYDLPFPLFMPISTASTTPSELEEIGLSPLPEGTLALIEWPERAPDALPADRIDIALQPSPGAGIDRARRRNHRLRQGGRAGRKAQALRQFLDGAGFPTRAQRMPGDASTRSYARLIRDDGVVILMNSPKRPDGPAIYDGKSYSAAVHLAEDVKPFVAIANGLRERGFSAPAIHHADLDAGFLITEDFGSAGVVEGDPPRPIAERYEAATDMLAALHRETCPKRCRWRRRSPTPFPAFDTDAMLVEIGLMLEWYLPDRGAEPSNCERIRRDVARAAGEAGGCAENLGDAGLSFAQHHLARRARRHRCASASSTSRTPCWARPPTIWCRCCRMRGSTCPSARACAADALHQGAARPTSSFDPAGFAELYAIMSAQRNTRLLGTFARLNRRDGKPQYLRHQPRIWTYLNRSLAHPALSAFRDWYAANVPPPVP